MIAQAQIQAIGRAEVFYFLGFVQACLALLALRTPGSGLTSLANVDCM